jgi:hypothetical protein
VSDFARVHPGTDVLAHLGHYVATIGFFVPAAVLLGIAVAAVVRDRRLHAREVSEERPSSATPPPPAD